MEKIKGKGYFTETSPWMTGFSGNPGGRSQSLEKIGIPWWTAWKWKDEQTIKSWELAKLAIAIQDFSRENKMCKKKVNY